MKLKLSEISRQQGDENVECIDLWIGRIVDKRDISTTLKRLPLQNLGHITRVKKSQSQVENSSEESSDIIQITVALVRDFPELGELVRFLAGLQLATRFDPNSFSQISLPRYPLLRRKVWEKWRSVWPLQFHATEHLKRLEEKFCIDQLDVVRHWMDRAQSQADLALQRGYIPIGIVVVDPISNELMAESHDMRPLTFLNSSLCKCSSVPLNAEDENNNSDNFDRWHPLDHATITGIRKVGQVHKERSSHSDKRRKLETQDAEDKLEASKELFHENGKYAPYLCTGYDAYITHEPCAFCAMALVHSRISRIFFRHLNSVSGAIATRYGLHEQKGLNHHYRAYHITDEEEITSKEVHESTSLTL